MNRKVTKICIIIFIITTILSNNVFANSSWHWVTTSPMTVLPIAIIITLLIEILGIKIFNRNLKTIKIIIAVIFANLLSFLAPYIERAYRFMAVTIDFSIEAAFNKGPYYIVLIGYLVLTLIIEIPIVYILLKKEVENKTKLLITIIITNIITTVLVAVLERAICIGSW